MRVVGLTLGTLLQCFDWERIGDEEIDMQEMVSVTLWKVNPFES